MYILTPDEQKGEGTRRDGNKKGACIRKFQLSINTNLPMVILVLIALTLSVNHLTI